MEECENPCAIRGPLHPLYPDYPAGALCERGTVSGAMANINLGDVVATTWANVCADDERRERDQVTILHRWRRARNGRWIDDGYRAPHRMVMKQLVESFGRSVKEGRG